MLLETGEQRKQSLQLTHMKTIYILQVNFYPSPKYRVRMDKRLPTIIAVKKKEWKILNLPRSSFWVWGQAFCYNVGQPNAVQSQPAMIRHWPKAWTGTKIYGAAGQSIKHSFLGGSTAIFLLCSSQQENSGFKSTFFCGVVGTPASSHRKEAS